MTEIVYEIDSDTDLNPYVVRPSSSSEGQARVRLVLFGALEGGLIEVASTGDPDQYLGLYTTGTGTHPSPSITMLENIQNPMISMYPAGIAGVVVGAKPAVAASGIEPKLSVGLGTYTPTPPSSPTIDSGTLRGIGTELIEVIKRLYWQASDEVFEDGVESKFSRSLLDVLANYGAIAVSALAKLVIDARANEEISAEALRWIGLMEDSSTKKQRLWLLEKSLSNPSARIRDGATLGISFMDDPSAAVILRDAIESEQIGELREDMEAVLEELGSA